MHLAIETIHAYADAELSPAERQAARAHLDDCVDCRKEVALVQDTAKLFAATSIEPSADFEDRVLAKTRAMPMPKKPVWASLRTGWALVPALSLGAVAVMAVGVYEQREAEHESRLAAEKARIMQQERAFEESAELAVADQADFLEEMDLMEELDVIEAMDGKVPG